jgi:hypothetical protein
MYIKQLKDWTVRYPDSWCNLPPDVSLKAQAILYYIFYVIPENYAGSCLEDLLFNNSKDGRASIRSGIKELKEKGFLIYKNGKK